MENQKKVGIWIRVSTEDQARGDSPEHHEKRAKLYAESKGWEVTTTYHLEALSGKSVMNYPETKRMLEDIRKGNISGIIFSKLARLARNTKELLDFADIFSEEEADLISLQEAIDTSTPAGRLFYTMIAAMAQWEREEIADRVAASIPVRAKLGKSLGGNPSLGYKWENDQVVIDEQFAPLRKLIYELFLKHKRKTTVATILNKQGYRTRSGAIFGENAIHRLLRDPLAKGERRVNFRKTVGNKIVFKPMSEWAIHPAPALVSVDTWDECNRLLDESEKKYKRVGPKPKHLLAGFVECACGKKMYVFHKTKEPAFVCKACNNRISENDLNEIYHEQLKTFLLTDTDLSSYLLKLDNELVEKEKLLNVVEEERINLKKNIDGLVKMRAMDEMTKDVFLEQYKPLEERYLQLYEQLPELQAAVDFLKIQSRSSDVILQDAKDLYTKWNELEFDEKRHIVELITEKIIIDKEDIHIKLSYLPTPKNNSTPPTTHSLNSGKSPLNLGVGVGYSQGTLAQEIFLRLLFLQWMRRKIIPYNPKLKQLARQLRNNSTQSEIRLWGHLRNKEMLGYDFDRQKPIDNYILDFFCYDLMLGIEVDGFTHTFEEQYAKDMVKEQRMNELGITVLQFDGKQVMNDIQNVIRVIEMYIEEHSQQRE